MAEGAKALPVVSSALQICAYPRALPGNRPDGHLTTGDLGFGRQSGGHCLQTQPRVNGLIVRDEEEIFTRIDADHAEGHIRPAWSRPGAHLAGGAELVGREAASPRVSQGLACHGGNTFYLNTLVIAVGREGGGAVYAQNNDCLGLWRQPPL